MECPNCGQAFPADEYQDLKSGVTSLGRVPESVRDDDPETEDTVDLLFSRRRGFSMRVKSFGALHDLYDRESN